MELTFIVHVHLGIPGDRLDGTQHRAQCNCNIGLLCEFLSDFIGRSGTAVSATNASQISVGACK